MSGLGPDPKSGNTFRLETERLVIDLPASDDVPILFGMIGGSDRAEICATLLWDGPESISEIANWVESCQTETFEDSGYHWVVRDRTGAFTGSSGQALGAIGTRPRGEPGRGDVGYWLGREYWGKGIMTEALSRLIEFGFHDLDYYKIEADVYTSNRRGLRLVERVGMKREGLVRQAYRKAGGFVDQTIYGILREEWDPHSP